MTRPSRAQVMMEMAHAVAQRGTCQRLKVGAVISREGRPISTGYNGNVTGLRHCDHETLPDIKGQDGTVIRSYRLEESGCQTAMHAEANAIAFSARYGVATEDAVIYVTHQPCLPCARLIVNAGIVTVFYDHPYRLLEGLALLHAADVQVYRLNAEAKSYELVKE